MSPRSQPIAQQTRTVTARIARLKEQLSSRTRDAFKSDSHYRTWHEKTSALLSELGDELSVLNEPGEYDQLPPGAGGRRSSRRYTTRLDEILKVA